jgi:hypothetical protein
VRYCQIGSCCHKLSNWLHEAVACAIKAVEIAADGFYDDDDISLQILHSYNTVEETTTNITNAISIGVTASNIALLLLFI